MDVIFLCSVFVFLITKFNCWFLFGMFVSIFDFRSLYVYFYFNSGLQYFYHMPLSI